MMIARKTGSGDCLGCAFPKMYEQKHKEIESTKEINAKLLMALERIIDDLPHKRDWLDPTVEQMARDTITKAEAGVR